MTKILDALADEERSLLVSILASKAPDLLADMQIGPLTPGPRERLYSVLTEVLVGAWLDTDNPPTPLTDAIRHLIGRLDQIQPREPERLVHQGRSAPGVPVPVGMEPYREIDPTHGTAPTWDLVGGRWVPGRSRATWAAPPEALRPVFDAAFRLDLSQPKAAEAVLRPRAKVQVMVPGGEADYYTDDAGHVVYIETEYGPPERPNPILDAPQPATTYLVHSAADGGRQPSHLMGTDEQARLVWAYPTRAYLKPGQPGQGPVPLGTLFGGQPSPVSPHTLLAFLDGAATDHLALLASQLIDESFQARLDRKSLLRLRLEASYDDEDSTPLRVVVHYWRDGNEVRSESFSTR